MATFRAGPPPGFFRVGWAHRDLLSFFYAECCGRSRVLDPAELATGWG